MKIRFRLSIWVIAIMAVVVTGVAFILLRQASNISVELNKKGIEYLAGQRAEFWKGREDGYIRALSTLANVMSDYESVPAEQRRDQYDEMLVSALAAEPGMVAIYTVWKPNAIDGMDARYIGRTGSGPTGQYAMTFSKETGKMVARTSTDIEATMAYIAGPDARKDRVDHPVPWKINGKDTFAIRVMVPIINTHTDEIVGGLGCLLSIDAIQSIVENTIATHDVIAGMVIYSGNGFILGNNRPERVGKMLLDVETQYGNRINEVNQAVLAGREIHLQSWSPLYNCNMEMVLVPFSLGNSDTTWTIMIGVTEAYMLTEVNTITKFTILLAVIAIAAAAVIVYFVLKSVTKPIDTITNTLKDISEGEGDLTRFIPEKGNDEITAMSRYFNQTLEKIKKLILVIKQEAAMLSDTGNELAGNMTETAAAINEISANIQSIKTRVINQSASVTETNATMEQVVSNINKLNGYVATQSEEISHSSSAIDAILNNINTVTTTLTDNVTNVNTLQEASKAGHSGLQDMVADIQEIARQSEDLLSINAVMENIASQTNLLSMNAAIEAAHAGEAGKGFAVVADEIRKLAESSGAQSKTVGTVLKNIKSSIDKITESTEIVITRFESIDTSVKTVADQEENIREAMDEQSKRSEVLLQSSGNVNEMTLKVKSGSEEMLDGSQEVIQESQNLEKATQEITNGINEIASGASQINVAVNHVNEISIKNREGISALIREVSQFKVE